MNKVRAVLLALGGVLFAGAGYLLLGTGSDLPEQPPTAAAAEANADDRWPVEAQRADGPGPTRLEVAGGAVPPAEADEDDEPRRRLMVTGRVVSDAGQPVAGARVAVSYRRSFGGPGGGREFARGGPEEMRRAFRARRAGTPAVTDAAGRFSLSGQAFVESALEIEVAHASYAPVLVRRDWRLTDGALELEDIVVSEGATVTGFVLNSHGQPLPGAEVRYAESGRGPGGGRGGRRGGRGGGGSEGLALEDLVPAARTNEAGRFEILHAPPGEFRVRAAASRHLAATSPPLRAKSRERVDAGELRLVLGVELRGVVLDASGAPIADARVEAGSSRELMAAAFSAMGGNDQDPLEVARGLMGIERRARTDAKGEFVIDSLPPAPLRVSIDHPRFVREEREPIDPTKEPRLTIHLQPALVVAGRVVDEQTGEPIEQFAVAVRPLENGWGGQGGRRGGDTFEGRGRRGRGGDESGPRPVNVGLDTPRAVDAPARGAGAAGQPGGTGGEGRGRRGGGQRPAQEQDPAAAAAREAQRQAERVAQDAQRESREAYLRDRLGPSGRVPRDPGRPAVHEGGRFEVGGLQPGRYTIDVSAPDHVMLAAGPVELVIGQNPAEVVVPLRRGARVRGRVEDRASRTPLVGARVELLLPDPEGAPAPEPGNPFANLGRPEGGRLRLQATRTDAEGNFVFKPQRGGAYWLRVEHEGYNGLLDRSVFVTDGRDTDVLAFALVPASAVSGEVQNGIPGTRYTVAFVSSTGRRITARTDAQQRYQIDSIEAGSYWVTLEMGEGRGMRGMGNRVLEFLRGDTRPDVVIAEGAKLRYDIDARAELPGTVQGTVSWNGSPAAGFEVTLSLANAEALAGDAGPGRMLGRFLGRSLSARTDAEGRFEIAEVPPGSYELEVRRAGGGGAGGGGGRGGRGGGGPGGASVHREPVAVTASGSVSRNIVLSTGAIAVTAELEADGKPLPRGNVALVLRSEAIDRPPESWRELPSYRAAPVRDGKAELRDLKVGEWQMRVQGQGVVPHEATIFVGQSPEAVPILVKLKAAEGAPPRQGR